MGWSCVCSVMVGLVLLVATMMAPDTCRVSDRWRSQANTMSRAATGNQEMGVLELPPCAGSNARLHHRRSYVELGFHLVTPGDERMDTQELEDWRIDIAVLRNFCVHSKEYLKTVRCCPSPEANTCVTQWYPNCRNSLVERISIFEGSVIPVRGNIRSNLV